MHAYFESLSQFHFARPLWLLCFIPLIALAVRLWNLQMQSGQWRNIISPHLLKYLIEGEESRPSHVPLYLLCFAWTLAIIALAGPVWRQVPQAVTQSLEARLIILDLSPSMLAADVTPSRYVRARYKILDLLAKSKSGQTGLMVFSSMPFTVTPMTTDIKTIENLVPSLSPEMMPNPGSNPAAAVKHAIELLDQAKLQSGTIYLFTDGVSDKSANEIISALNNTNYRLNVLAIGTAEGAPIPQQHGGFLKDASGNIVIPKLDINPLRRIAEQCKGHFSEMTTSDADINLIASDEIGRAHV